MNLRALNLYNIVQTAKDEPITIVEEVQRIIDNDENDVPGEVISRENILRSQKLQAYYSNHHSYLVGLWGAMRVAAGTDKQLIAVRDYLEVAVSSCKLKYQAASRVLTGYETIQNDSGMKERPL
jgi:hypothetical protein